MLKIHTDQIIKMTDPAWSCMMEQARFLQADQGATVEQQN
jgi:hypothetical protein